MSLVLKTFNVLLYEPRGIRAELRIAESVLTAVEGRASDAIRRSLVPEMVRLGLATEATGLLDIAARAGRVPPAVADNLPIPEDERFVLNATPYERLGGVPGVLGDFARAYSEMAGDGIAVTFLNTACSVAANDFARLAEVIDEFPAMYESTWVVTSSLREPLPENFRALVERRAGPANPAGGSARRLAVTTGSPCYVPIGDSIVMRAAGEAVATIHERLKFLRKFGRDGAG